MAILPELPGRGVAEAAVKDWSIVVFAFFLVTFCIIIRVSLCEDGCVMSYSLCNLRAKADTILLKEALLVTKKRDDSLT